MRVVEISAFVAAPLAGMTLAQLGAEVIRIDPIGGNIDYHRWPVTPEGDSIYWRSLNRGKRSVELDLRSAEGQQSATDIIASSGAVLTNLPAHGWLDYDRLRQRREDLIMLRLLGNSDGSPAVDYTVNAASGFPSVTGTDDAPVNNVVPTWDVTAGLYIATGMLSAELSRRETGRGQEITLALSDVMLATVGNLGYIAEVSLTGASRGSIGNAVYGAYGQSFRTGDGRSLMVVAISNSQWRRLGEATGLSDKLAMIGPMLDVDLSTEGGRYEAREAIDAVLRPWFASRTADEAAVTLQEADVLQGKFQNFAELVAKDPRCSVANPLFTEIDQPGLGAIIAPRSPLTFGGTPAPSASPAPELGVDTDDVIGSVGESQSRE